MGKWIHQLKQKNEGSALILVLICMTFLGLLGSVVLTATVSNMKMKTVDALSKDNFYTAETAVDELKVGLEEEAQNCMKKAYSYMLQRYSTTPDSERAKLLMRKFVTLFYNELALTDYDPTQPYEPSDVDEVTLKENYLLSPTGKQAVFASGGGIKVKLDFTDLSVTLMNVSIRYTDTLGYESTITTDIKISATYPSLSTREVSNAGVYYLDFALIADQAIIKESADETIINGNVYGGSGILASNENTVLQLNSNKVITRKAIEASNKAKIVIPGQYNDDSVLINSVWVNDLQTKCDKPASELKDYLEITANCYVQDDLTLGAKYGRVKIAGNYYGYQISNAQMGTPSGNAAGSSSVSINARNAVLDFKDVKNLWISGKAYLSVPSVYGSSSSGLDPSQVLEGESISFKGDQVAYLVPGNCIVGIGHNPMTVTEYNMLGTSIDYKVDITQNGILGGIQLEKYVYPDSSYTAHFVRYRQDDVTMQMVYLFLNFQSADLASDYFYEYQQNNTNKVKLENIADNLELGSVILPESPETMVNTGTVLEYDTVTKSLTYTNRRKYYPSGDVPISSSADELQTKLAEYSSQYKGLITCLNENYRATGQSNSLVQNLVRYEDDDVSHVQGIINAAQDKYNNSLPHTYDIYKKEVANTYILVTGRTEDVVIEGYDKSGLIITQGDVIVKGCTFKGLIITMGNIKLQAGAKVDANAAYVKNIIDTTPEVNQFFYDYTASGPSAGGNTNTILITYENWYKE